LLAVKLHRNPKVSLGKEASLVPIIDWRSGRVQIAARLRWTKQDRYLTLVRIPDDHPVRICFTYGNSNFLKQVVWPSEFRPLREWPREYVRAIAEWWDARSWPNGDVEPGGVMVDEPRVFLGGKLPDSCIRWTKDVRLLYRRPPARGQWRTAARPVIGRSPGRCRSGPTSLQRQHGRARREA
jgi:hypothetical protein